MNNQQKDAASSMLQLFNVELPHSDEECQRVLKAHQDWHTQNSDIQSIEQVRVRAERGSLGYMAAIEEAANEIKANRSRR